MKPPLRNEWMTTLVLKNLVKQIVSILLLLPLQRLTLKPSAVLCTCGAILNSELMKILYFVQVNLSDIVIKASEQHTCYWRIIGHTCLPNSPHHLTHLEEPTECLVSTAHDILNWWLLLFKRNYKPTHWLDLEAIVQWALIPVTHLKIVRDDVTELLIARLWRFSVEGEQVAIRKVGRSVCITAAWLPLSSKHF